jgi:putative copper resistance protein D
MLIRVVHLGAGLALVGSFAFPLLVARPAFQEGEQAHWQAGAHFECSLRRMGIWSLVGLVGSGLLGLWVQLALVTDRSLLTAPSFEALHQFLTGTQYGRVWSLRLGLAALLGGVLLLRGREWHGPHWWGLRLAGAGLAGGLLAAQAWAGHAAAAEGAVLFRQMAVDVLHLLAAGVWLGSLPPLAVLLAWAQRADHASAERIAAEATRRFSALGLGSILLLVVTGVASAWALVGSIPALIGTPYGHLLLVKLGLLLPILVLAAINLRHEKPRLLLVVAAQQRRQTRETLRRLRRNVLLEAALGVAILLLVGGLGVTPPARHVPPTWPLAFRLSWEATRALPGIQWRVLLGSHAVLVGLLALGYAVLGRRWRWAVAGVGVVSLPAGLWVIVQALAIDAYPTTYLRPAVPYQALSIANGLRLYQEHCAVCHGIAGYGDGPAAAALTPRPADLTAKHTADHTAGDLFWWLSYGIKGRAMPGFHDRLSAEERWDLINFLRTLAAAEQARSLGPQVEPEPWLVAPDFSYTTVAGDGQTLKDQRGRNLVLLVFFRLPGSHDRLTQLHNLSPHLHRLGVEVLAVPLRTDHEASLELGTFPRLPMVADGATEAVITYTLFRKSLSPTGRLPIPPFPSHLEFLIDRQGYIRTRWLPGSGPRWAEAEALLATIEWLNHEKPRRPAPDEHIH